MKLFFFLSLILALPALWYITGDPEAPGNSAQGTASRQPASAADLHGHEDQFSFQPEEGSGYAYQFQRRIEIQGLAGDFPLIAYEGTLWIEVMEAGPGGFSALVREEIKGQPVSQVRLKIRVDSRGEKLEIYSKERDSEEERQHESVIKDLLAQFFFPLRSDTAGDYDARLEGMAAEKGFLRFRKTKNGYLGGASAARIESSSHLIKWNLSLRMPQEIRGSERTLLGQGESRIESRADYLISFAGKKRNADAMRAAWSDLAAPDSLALKQGAQARQSHPDYARLRWDETLARLGSLGSMSESDRLKVFGDLVKLFAMGKGDPGALVALLRESGALRQGVDSPLFQTAIGALATDGSDSSQAALREIYLDPESAVSARGSILGALTTTQAPLNAETRALLAAEMEGNKNPDLAEGAAFALGASLEKMDAGREATDAVSRLSVAWEQAQASGERRILSVLDAMGNSGRTEFLPLIKRAAESDPNPVVRARAVFSLRSIRADGARALLASALSDPEKSVRTAAVTAITFAEWSESFRPTIERCIAEEQIKEIRAACERVRNAAGQKLAGI